MSALPLALLLNGPVAPGAFAQSVIVSGDTTPMPPDGVLAGDLRIGETGAGSLSITDGGAVSNENATLGWDPGSDGAAIVSGADPGGTPSRWDSAGYLEIGAGGNGTLTVEQGGVVTSAEGYIAGVVNSIGTVTVTGDGSAWSNAGLLSIGHSGTGSLTIADGGAVSTGNAVVGGEGAGNVLVTGEGSSWTSSGEITLGIFDGASGSLRIEAGAAVTSDTGTLGSEGTGDVIVTGEGSRWINAGRITVGAFSTGAGTLRIEDGAAVTSGLSIVGSGGTGDVIVTGGAGWATTDQLVVGSYSAGTLTIDGGSAVTSSQVYIGADSTGAVTVAGAGSSWASDNEITIGNYGTGTLAVSDGGRVRADDRIYLGASGGGGTLTVSGSPAGRGVLETGQISAGNGSADVTLDGGILRATRSNTNFISGFGARAVAIGSGDAFIDTAGFDIGIAAHLAGAGGLQKMGAGTLMLSAENSYAGGTVISGGTLQIANDANLGAAAGAVTLDAGTLATTADITSARAVVVAGAGTLFTAGGTRFALDGLLSGSGALTKSGGGSLVLAGDSAGYAGDARVDAGMLVVDGTLGGTLAVEAAGRLEGNGRVGSVAHAGIIAPGHGGIGRLTIAGDYVGNGGVLEIEAALAGDGSPADRLVVTGSTSGAAQVVVINRGGTGDQTVDGIKIIDAGGASNASFSLRGDYVFQGQQTVVAGAYGYRLYQNGVIDPDDGDWYLRSSLLDPSSGGGDGSAERWLPLYQPGVPVYEAYPQTLLALNGLPTLQWRVGNRSWATAPTEAGTGIWGRVEAARYRPQADVSTSGADNDADLWQLQMGADATLTERKEGSALIGGLTIHYGKADADIGSLHGDGSIKTRGYGLGATLTWYGARGFYADGQAQFSWYDSDLRSSLLGRLADGNDGTGMAFSIEVGQRVAMGEALSVTPQAQLVYSEVDFDRFHDSTGAAVGMDEGDSLEGRWGLSIDWQEVGDTAAGGTRRTHLYGIVNLRYEWFDGTRVAVSGTPINNRDERWRGELGVGGSYGAADRFTLYAEVAADTSIDHFGDRYSLRGTAGLRVRF